MAPPSFSGQRPENGPILAVFLTVSFIGLYVMRIVPAIAGIPIGFPDIMASGIHPNGTPVKRTYTGVKPFDEGLAFLVTAFLPGLRKWNEVFYWQQVHFLVQIGAIVAIMNVEACRGRNAKSWLKYTALFAFLYQNVGGAIIIPIWMFLLHRISGSDSYFSSGRAVPLAYARLILPSTLLIFTLPTILTLYPWESTALHQDLNAFWQLGPVLVNVPLWLAAPFVDSTFAMRGVKSDLPHLRILYKTLFGISIASHWYVVFGISTSANPSVTFASVFVPTMTTWKISMDWGLLWIFQVDWMVCTVMHHLPSWIAVMDVERLTKGSVRPAELAKAVGWIVGLTLVGGPAAALTLFWGWREEELALIEDRSVEKKKL